MKSFRQMVCSTKRLRFSEFDPCLEFFRKISISVLGVRFRCSLFFRKFYKVEICDKVDILKRSVCFLQIGFFSWCS